MHGSGAVAGIGESTYYKRGESPHTEFQLACVAIRHAVEDAGLELAFCDSIRRHPNGKPDYAWARTVAVHATAATAPAAS